MKKLISYPLSATKATYKGQKVISQLKALRTNEIKHRMSLEVCNLVEELNNNYKKAGYLTTVQFQTVLDLFFTYVLKDRNDNK